MRSGSPRRRRFEVFGLSITLFFLAVLLSTLPVIRELQVRLTDTLFHLAPAPRERSRVVLVLIDDDSLQKYGRWPWSRVLLAQLTDKLTQAGAATVGLDILLSESQTPQADWELQRSFKSSGRVVIVDKIAALPDGFHWIEPLPDLARSAAAVGHAHAVLDPDSVCRRFPPRELTLDGPRWSFAIEVARRVSEQNTTRFLAAYGISAGEGASPMTIAQPVLAPIAFRRDGFDSISAGRVLSAADPSFLRGRPVLVGFGSTEIGDRLSTPLSTELPTPGVEVHAQILDSILTQRRLKEVPLWLLALALYFTCVLVIILFRRWRGFLALALLALMAAAVYGIALLVFARSLYVLPAGPLMLSVILGPLLVFTSDFVIVERSVSRQLLGLRSWLALKGRSLPREDKSDLSWRLDLLHKLQTDLGALYELHQTLLESTRDLVAIFDQNGRVMLKNRAFSAAFDGSAEAGLTLEQVRTCWVAKEDAPLISTAGLTEGEVYLDQELYSVRIAPLPPTTLSPGGGTLLTLTSLRTRVERDRARAEALGFITHELRTPLASIQGFAELMMQYPGSEDSRDAPETIYRESKRLLALISSYLDVLRLDAGAKPLSLNMVDIEGIVRQVFDILQPLANASGMRLTVEAVGDASAMADVPLISGAILNLVSNAIKYGQPNTEVSVACVRQCDEILIRVHNIGRPISQDEISRIFDPYYRASNVDSSKAGWGLGLAFVRRIAEKHGGTVRAESRTDGTTFEIRLPAKFEASRPVGEST